MGAINGQTIRAGIKMLGGACKRYLPSILIGVGIGGMVTGTVVAVRATPQFQEDMENQKDEEAQVAEMLDRDPKKDIWARTKIVAKHYWPAAAISMTGAGCIIFANSTHLKREAALMCLAASNKKELEAFKKKIIELDGDKKLTKLTDNVSTQDMADNPVENSQVILVGNGDQLFYDAWSGRYFMSTTEKVRQAELDMNWCLLENGYFSINDYYELLRLPILDGGGLLGWHCDRSDQKVRLDFTSKLLEDGRVAIAVRFDTMPVYEFDTYG